MDLTTYLGSFNPASVCTNYLGDSGSQLGTGIAISSSVVVPNGQPFVVVINAHRPGIDCGQFCFTLESVACGVTCPNNVALGTGPGSTQCGANAPFTVTQSCGAAVNCSAGGFPVQSGDFFPVGMTSVSCSDGSHQCSFDLTVNDTTPPATSCPAPTSAPASSDACEAPVPNIVGGVSAPDNCVPGSQVTIGCLPTAGTPVGLGTTTLTCTASDGTNQAGCSTGFTVLDTDPPAVTCPTDITTDADPESCATDVIYETPSATEACGGANVVCMPPSGSSFPVGSTAVTCTATDEANNSNPCMFRVDVKAPEGACPAIFSDGFEFGLTNTWSAKTT